MAPADLAAELRRIAAGCGNAHRATLEAAIALVESHPLVQLETIEVKQAAIYVIRVNGHIPPPIVQMLAEKWDEVTADLPFIANMFFLDDRLQIDEMDDGQLERVGLQRIPLASLKPLSQFRN